MNWLGMNAATGRAVSATDHIVQSVRDILITPVGSRVMRRDYGSELFYLIDHPQHQATRQDGDQHRFSVADRDAYTGVTAYWQDNKAAEKKKIEVKRKKKAKPKQERPLPPGVVVNKKEHELLVGDSENVKELRHVYANQTNAMRAARAEWERIQRGVAEFDITLAKGRPELYPEQPTTVRGFKPDIDAAPWLLTQVVHDLTNQGYTNRVQLEVKLEELPE